MSTSTMDSRFTVKTLAQTESPNQLVWLALHQCHSDRYVGECDVPHESKCASIIIDRLLAGDRGHFGCLEHPSISFAVGGFPHSTMQQARTHRVGVTFDVQSFRYTGDKILEVAKDKVQPEEVFYVRPVGVYTDRNGNRFEYTQELRDRDSGWCRHMAQLYRESIEKGMPNEQARSTIPFDIRQDWVVTFNARSLMHFLDLRAKKNAQLEIQQLCELLFVEFDRWMPELADWYKGNRWGKAKLAP